RPMRAPVEPPPDLDELLGDLDDVLPPEPDEDVDDRTLIAGAAGSPARAPQPVPAGDARQRERTDAEVEGELEEAEFFLQQGLLEEARLILVELARARPARKDISGQLKDVEKKLV